MYLFRHVSSFTLPSLAAYRPAISTHTWRKKAHRLAARLAPDLILERYGPNLEPAENHFLLHLSLWICTDVFAREISQSTAVIYDRNSSRFNDNWNDVHRQGRTALGGAKDLGLGDQIVPSIMTVTRGVRRVSTAQLLIFLASMKRAL